MAFRTIGMSQSDMDFEDKRDETIIAFKSQKITEKEARTCLNGMGLSDSQVDEDLFEDFIQTD